MSVSGVGGAASLPITLANPPQNIADTNPNLNAVATDEVSANNLRFPEKQNNLPNASVTEPPKEVPKPAPLPPLRGLTVAEIRAMLGVAPLPGQIEATAAAAANSIETSIISAALARYT
jgi:hypothetical protein